MEVRHEELDFEDRDLHTKLTERPELASGVVEDLAAVQGGEALQSPAQVKALARLKASVNRDTFRKKVLVDFPAPERELERQLSDVLKLLGARLVGCGWKEHEELVDKEGERVGHLHEHFQLLRVLH